jgi:GNAT superfamily N-acetyltransferase
MRIEIRNRCSDFNSYRANRVKSLFNAESGCNFDRDVELPIEGLDWKIGLVVGASGSGKTSIGRKFPCGITDIHAGWPERKPVIDAIAPGGSFDAVTGALAAVGLGDVPAWLRPFRCLSNGEQFRAGLARLIAEAPPFAVVDEFTSVIDRQIAKVGSLAFGKAWRRAGGRCVLLSCHYDIIEWLQPDWVYDTTKGEFAGRERRRPPPIALDIRRTDGRWWHLFEPHHYLKLPRMIAAKYYVGFVDGQPVCHAAVSPRLDVGGMRACRLVVMPEWQGAGLGVRFLNEVCRLTMAGDHGFGGRVWRGVYFHTSHPGLAAALRRSPGWRQVSASLCGQNKEKSRDPIRKPLMRHGGSESRIPATGYGGHFRAVQGFIYEGHKNAQA